MNKELIMKADVLDILFENRNKDYGAYNLRKYYSDRLGKALGIMMVIVSGLALLGLLSPKVASLVTRTYTMDEIKLQQVELEAAQPVKKQEIVKPEVKLTTPDQLKFLSNFLIVKDNIKTDTFQVIKETDNIGNNNVKGDSAGAINKPVNTGNGGSTEAAPVKIEKPATYGLDEVDVPPSYPGGVEALRKFLQRNLQNPKDMEEGESVSVKIKFVVGYNGKLQSFVTVEDGGEEFNKEVIRVLKKMPDWIPGKAKGENVPVYYSIPVKFVPAN